MEVSSASGDIIGNYQAITEIGRGGVAQVLLCRHIHPQYAERTFAVKLMHDHVAKDPEVRRFFQAEAYLLAMLKHPNIVQTFEAGVDEARLYIAMEYINGRDLGNAIDRHMQQQRLVPLPIALHILGEVLKALSYAHALADADGKPLNIAHRDLNPFNVFLSFDGDVKLGDFGVAALAASSEEDRHSVSGKPGYFAPEQLRGEDSDHRVDLYAFGAMMYLMLCGQHPFAGKDVDAIMRLNEKGKFVKPKNLNHDLDPGLIAIIIKALERKPSKRYSTAEEILADLKVFLADWSDMRLGVVAMMRTVFLREHMATIQLRRQLEGKDAGSLSNDKIGLCHGDARMRQELARLLAERKFQVQQYTAPQEAVADAQPPAAIILDVGRDTLHSQQWKSLLAQGEALIPVVAATADLEVEGIGRAASIGASDILYQPFDPDRVLTAMWTAITVGAKRPRGPEAATQEQPSARVLLVSSDDDLSGRLSQALPQSGFEVQVVATKDAAIAAINLATYQAVLYDVHPAPQPDDREFADRVRGCVGIGVLPVLFLADQQFHADFAGIERSEARPRADLPMLLGGSLKRLCAPSKSARSFLRFPALVPVELRFGGRTHEGTGTDVSRGGMMIMCDAMPHVGASANLRMRLPTSDQLVEAIGRVARVNLSTESSDNRAGIGVEFTRFASNESALIAYIEQLESSARR